MGKKNPSSSPGILHLPLMLVLLVACGGDGSVSGTSPAPPIEPAPPEEPSNCEGGKDYESTFDAIQDIVFEGYDCVGCHAQPNPSGGLDLTRGNSYDSLVEVPSQVSSEKRVKIGSAFRSVLYRKVEPDEPTPGGDMPPDGRVLSEKHRRLIHSWIYAGAPREGVVIDSLEFIDGCLPPAEPIGIEPLAVPASDQGVQIAMPRFRLPAGLESERCYASYFDVCDEIPADLRRVRADTGTEVFPVGARELRMTQGSHHLILNYSIVDTESVEDPAWGGWRCSYGTEEGKACSPLDRDSCGDGVCISEAREGFTCSGFGPVTPGVARNFFPIGGAQRSQDYQEYPEGVYNEIPCSGFLLWNTHNFNLTVEEQVPEGWLNYYFADPDELLYPGRGGLIGPIFIADNPPFTKETYCSEWTLPRGGRLYQVGSHTHARGERFWVMDPQGNQIYENKIYNDPNEERFEPALEFDSCDAEERTLTFCATYNNGVNPDGTPNVETVTRASRVPESARVPGSFGTCVPNACVNDGMVGEACNGESAESDALCDTSPGAGDGNCDACDITGGESTENEMFLLIPGWYVVDVEEPCS